MNEVLGDKKYIGVAWIAKVGATLLVALCALSLFATESFARGVYFRADGTSGSGRAHTDAGFTVPLSTTNAVQYIQGSPVPPSATTPFIANGTALATGTIGEGVAGTPAGTFYRYAPNAQGNVFVRVWNTGTPARGGRYGNSSSFSVNPDPGALPQDFNIVNFWTQYIADTPTAPTGVAVSAIRYDSATVNWSNPSDYELSGVDIIYGSIEAQVMNGTTPTVSSGPTASYTIGFDIGDPKALIPGTQYWVKARIKNNFGDSAWSDLVNFRTLGATGGGGVVIQGMVYDVGITLVRVPTVSESARVRLAWKAPSDITAVRVFRSIISPTTGFSEITSGIIFGPSPIRTAEFDESASSAYYRVVPQAVTDPTAAPREVVGKYTYVFNVSRDTTRPNAFTFSLPFTVSGLSQASHVMAQLVAQNAGLTPALATGDIEYVGRWNEENQKSEGYLGAAGGTDFGIPSGKAYQLAIKRRSADYTVRWTLVGRN